MESVQVEHKCPQQRAWKFCCTHCWWLHACSFTECSWYQASRFLHMLTALDAAALPRLQARRPAGQAVWKEGEAEQQQTLAAVVKPPLSARHRLDEDAA